MAEKSVIINDAYLIEMGKFYKETAEQLEEVMEMYLNVMEMINIRTMEGDIAEGLQVFIQYAKKMKGQISVMGRIGKQAEEYFLKAVDRADQYLF